MRIQLHHLNPQARFVKQIAEALQKGAVAVFPTDSGYALGCSARSAAGIKKLYFLKRQVKKYSLSLIVPDFPTIAEFAEVENSAYRYMKTRLPGHYTMILPTTKYAKKTLNVNREEIGIRMPDHPFFKALWEVFTDPLLASTAHVSEDEVLADPDELSREYESQVDLIAEMGVIPIKPTEVVSLVTGEAVVIREGE